MDNSIVVAIITGGLSAIVTIITLIVNNKKSALLTATKIEILNKKVEEHNKYAQHMPVINEKISRLETDVIELKKLLNMRG